jgi:tRNA threonylcarbamoyladenosine biosynthesis protein TsaE
MSTGQTWQTESTSSRDTLKIASVIGSKLRGGEAIELLSDLGGGKTTFVKGLAAGMGSQDEVGSPSFTLSNVYRAGSLTLYHFDFYRLSEAGIMSDEIAEVIADPKVVVVVEWPDVVQDVLPAKRVTVRLIPVAENSRRLEFSYPSELSYLLAGLQ